MEPMPSPAEDPLTAAVERLVGELEREHEWLAELKRDTGRVERRCGHLLNAADAALSALDPVERRPFMIRVKRLQIETMRFGRPPKDSRMSALLAFLAERGQGRVTNAEVRTHLNRLGLKGTSDYVGQTLHRLMGDGLVHRAGYGEYAIAADHPRLRALRFRADRSGTLAEMRAEMAKLREMQGRGAGEA